MLRADAEGGAGLGRHLKEYPSMDSKDNDKKKKFSIWKVLAPREHFLRADHERNKSTFKKLAFLKEPLGKPNTFPLS